MPLLASIPSPSDGTLHLGPIPLHVYGILLATGIVVAAIFTERRWGSWGHERREWQEIVVIAVVAGIIGARLYHVATDYEKFENDWLRVFQLSATRGDGLDGWCEYLRRERAAC